MQDLIKGIDALGVICLLGSMEALMTAFLVWSLGMIMLGVEHLSAIEIDPEERGGGGVVSWNLLHTYHWTLNIEWKLNATPINHKVNALSNSLLEMCPTYLSFPSKHDTCSYVTLLKMNWHKLTKPNHINFSISSTYPLSLPLLIDYSWKKQAWMTPKSTIVMYICFLSFSSSTWLVGWSILSPLAVVNIILI